MIRIQSSKRVYGDACTLVDLSLCLDSGLCSDQNFLNLTAAAAGLKSRLDIITYLPIVVIFTNPYIENWMRLLKNQTAILKSS